MSDASNLSREEQLRRMAWRECIICKEHFGVLEQHIIDEHFRGSADNALAKWLIALNEDVDKTMDNLGYKKRSQKKRYQK